MLRRAFGEESARLKRASAHEFPRPLLSRPAGVGSPTWDYERRIG